MWARISEIILGIWLFLAHILFETGDWADLACGVLIILFAGLSYIEKINKLHLLQVIPAGWLLYVSYIYPTHLLPLFMQNYILVALFLLMFCIIPSHASDHPRAWKKFLQDK